MGQPPPPDGPPVVPDPPPPPEVPFPPTGACITTPPLPTIELLPPGIGAGFGASIQGFGLCGFTIPPNFGFNVSFGVKLPDFTFPPLFFFALCLNCDLANPIETEFGFGGGRVSNTDIDADFDADFA